MTTWLKLLQLLTTDFAAAFNYTCKTLVKSNRGNVVRIL